MAIGLGVDPSTKVYELGITAPEVEGDSSSGTKTLIIMLFGVLPFFICLGMYLTSIYLPQTKLGSWVNVKKDKLKTCCGKSSKRKIEMREVHESKEFLG